jgi:hypothetical protein
MWSPDRVSGKMINDWDEILIFGVKRYLKNLTTEWHGGMHGVTLYTKTLRNSVCTLWNSVVNLFILFFSDSHGYIFTP